MLLLQAEALICPITVVSGNLPSFMLLLLRTSCCEGAAHCGHMKRWPCCKAALLCVWRRAEVTQRDMGASWCMSPAQRGTACQDTLLMGLVVAMQGQCPGQPGQGSTMYRHACLQLPRNITGAWSEGSHGALFFFSCLFSFPAFIYLFINWLGYLSFPIVSFLFPSHRSSIFPHIPLKTAKC